jgi:hypothetical protein
VRTWYSCAVEINQSDDKQQFEANKTGKHSADQIEVTQVAGFVFFVLREEAEGARSQVAFNYSRTS